MASEQIPAPLADFVSAVRALWQEPLGESERWARVAELLPMLLESKAIQDLAKGWPQPPENHPRPQNLLFYEDPDYRFVVNGLVKRPGEATPLHDHAHTWTVYSVLEGEEKVVRYRQDGGALAEEGVYTVRPGFIDIVPPRMIHAEFAGPARTVALIIRSERVGGFPQRRFDAKTGAESAAPGPEQVPYTL